VTILQKGSGFIEGGPQIGNCLDHLAIWDEGAGDGPYLVAGCETHLCAGVGFGQIGPVDLQPEPLSALLEGSNSRLGKACSTAHALIPPVLHPAMGTPPKRQFRS
jgi:hypothetical protein